MVHFVLKKKKKNKEFYDILIHNRNSNFTIENFQQGSKTEFTSMFLGRNSD